MAEQGSLPAGEYGRKPPTGLAQRRAAERVDTSMHTMQSLGFKPSRNGARAKAEVDELPPRDDPVLPRRNERQPPLSLQSRAWREL
jgi:hypothetical protein